MKGITCTVCPSGLDIAITTFKSFTKFKTITKIVEQKYVKNKGEKLIYLLGQ